MNAPLSVAAERKILGAMMQSREATETASRHLATADFHDYRNGRVYDELLELWGANEPTDPIFLMKRLSERGELTKPETGVYLAELYAEACGVREIGSYATVVTDAANQRGWTLTAAELAQAALLTNPAVRADRTAQILADGAARALSTAQTSGRRAVLTKASSFAMKGARWLHKGLIPAGAVTLLAGREGIGKSTVALDIAARLTRGTLTGRYEGRPQAVILLATEDSWETTIRPRLQAVSADLDLVYHLAIQEDGSQRGVIVATDTAEVEKAVHAIRPALMIIDPLMSVLGGKVDTHRQSDVQAALEPLVALCGRIDMAVLALIHVNKGSGGDALSSVMGSRAFTSLPRSVLMCIEEEDGQFMFTHAKCNIGPKMPSRAYTLAGVRFDMDPDTVEEGDEDHIFTSRVVWGAEDTRTADEILSDKATAGAASNTGQARQAVMAVADSVEGVVNKMRFVEELANEFDDGQINNALKRLVKSGNLMKIGYGVYQSAKWSPK